MKSVFRRNCHSLLSLMHLLFKHYLPQLWFYAMPTELQGKLYYSTVADGSPREGWWTTARNNQLTFFLLHFTHLLCHSGSWMKLLPLPVLTSKTSWWKVLCTHSPSPSISKDEDVLWRHGSSVLHCGSYMKDCWWQRTELQADPVGTQPSHLHTVKKKGSDAGMIIQHLLSAPFYFRNINITKDLQSQRLLGQNKDNKYFKNT